MVVRNEGETVEADLVNGIDGLKNTRHPLETLKIENNLLTLTK
jgi:hypothetical protein